RGARSRWRAPWRDIISVGARAPARRGRRATHHGIIGIAVALLEASMDPKRVIRSYLTISALFTLSASLIWGINTLFLLHAGLTIFEVFVANAAFTAAMALFEIPTGVVADTRGRRASFLLSEATLAVGTLAYVGVAAIHG